jgi:cytochrome P450
LDILALYAREALRLDPVTVGITREVGASMFVPGTAEPLDLHAGEKVFLSLKKANLDEVCACLSISKSLDP